MRPTTEARHQVAKALAERMCLTLGMSLDELRQRDRNADTIKVKRFLIRQLYGAGCTLNEIGDTLGLCHSTVHYHLFPERKRGNHA